MADDYTHDIDTTGLVVVGGQTNGDIEQPGDEDWIKVTLQAGTTYRVELLGGWDLVSMSPNESRMVLWSPHWGTDAVFTSGPKGQPVLDYVAPLSGTYYVSMQGIRKAAAYALRVTESPVDDHHGNTTTTDTLAIGSTITGAMELNRDKDWLKVELQAGTTYAFAVNGQALVAEAGWATVPVVGLYDSSGTSLASEAGHNPLLYYTAASTGTFYVGVEATQDRMTGSYTLSAMLPSVVDDYRSDATTTGTVAVGGQVTGTLELGGDEDWIAVTLQGGTTYAIALRGAHSGGGTLAAGAQHDLVVSLPAGHDYPPYASATDGGVGGDPLLYYMPLRTATVYIAVDERSGKGVGTYTLEVAPSTLDDFTGNASTTGTLAIGGQAAGRLERSLDQDWFKVTLDAGKNYTFGMRGVADGGSGYWEWGSPQLGLYTADGYALAERYFYGSSDEAEHLFYTPGSSGTYYLGVSRLFGEEYRAKSYILDAATTDDDYLGSIATTATIAVNGEITGQLSAGPDKDWFRIELAPGTTYSFDLRDASTGLKFENYDRLLHVYDSKGTELWPSSDISATVYYTTRTAGTYYLGVDGGQNHGTTPYTVRARTAPDDFAGYVNTQGSVAVGGETAARIEYLNDVDWFSVSLQAGTTYAFETLSPQGWPTHRGLLSLHGADGSRVDSDADGDTTLYYTAESSGLHYVGLQGSTLTPNGIAYTLRARIATDDYADNTTTAGTVAVGSQVSGNVEYRSDEDWFKVKLEAGTTYAFELRGAKGGGGTLGTTAPALASLNLYNAHGDFVRSEYAGGASGNPLLHYTPVQSGTYHLGVKELNENGLGTYTLNVATATVGDDYKDDISTTASLAIGERRTGQIEFAGDEDWFRVELQAGAIYKFALNDLTGGAESRADAVVTIYDSGGAGVYAEVDSPQGGYFTPYFQSAFSGTYYVGVREMAHSQNWTYALDLSVYDTNADQHSAGTANNDVFIATANLASINGDAGIDVVRFDSARPWDLMRGMEADTWRVGGLLLADIERLDFADVNIALDMDGHAGIVAKTIGAVLGAGALGNPVYAGIGLDFLAGNASYEALMDMALNAILGPDAGNTQVVNLLYRNVAGVEADAEAQAYYVSLLEDGIFTRAGLGVYAADYSLNLANIDLVGLSATGLLYA